MSIARNSAAKWSITGNVELVCLSRWPAKLERVTPLSIISVLIHEYSRAFELKSSSEIGFSGPISFVDTFWPIEGYDEIGENVYRVYFVQDFDGFKNGTSIDFYFGHIEFTGSVAHHPSVNFVAICDKNGLMLDTTTDGIFLFLFFSIYSVILHYTGIFDLYFILWP